MKKKFITIIFSLVLLTFFTNDTHSYNLPRAGGAYITVKANVILNSNSGKYEYNYTVTNDKESKQKLERYFVEYYDKNPEVISPDNWKYTLSNQGKTDYSGEGLTPNNKWKVTWYARFSYFLKPGNTQEGFILKSVCRSV